MQLDNIFEVQTLMKDMAPKEEKESKEVKEEKEVQKVQGQILILDVETTGLPPRGCEPTEETCHLWPHVTQLSAVLYDTEVNCIVSHINYYVKIPTDIAIPEIVTQITGIDVHVCAKLGLPIQDVLLSLYEMYSECDCMVAHNYAFDSKMLMVEMLRNRYALPPYARSMFLASIPPHICTMEDNNMLCKIWHTNAKTGSRFIKFPRLSELYERIFGRSPEPYGLHNSMVDTLICYRCFLFTEYDALIPESDFLGTVELFKQPGLRPSYSVASRLRKR